MREQPSGRTMAIAQQQTGGEPTPATVTVTTDASGPEAEMSEGQIPEFLQLQNTIFRFSAVQSNELKVWVHQLVSEGVSEGLPVFAEVVQQGRLRRYDLGLSDGQLLVPLHEKGPLEVWILLAEAASA